MFSLENKQQMVMPALQSTTNLMKLGIGHPALLLHAGIGMHCTHVGSNSRVCCVVAIVPPARQSCVFCAMRVQEQSFKEFAQRPENRALMEEHQQQEVSAALQLQEQMQELHLQQQVRPDKLTTCNLQPQPSR